MTHIKKRPRERTVIYYLTRRSRAKQINNSIMTHVNAIWGRLLSVLMNNGNTHHLLIQLFQDYSKTSKHGDNNNKTPMDISWSDMIYECFNDWSTGFTTWVNGSQNKPVPEPKQDISSTRTAPFESETKPTGCDVKLKFLLSFNPINCLSVPTMHFCTGRPTTRRWIQNEKHLFTWWDLLHCFRNGCNGAFSPSKSIPNGFIWELREHCESWEKLVMRNGSLDSIKDWR